MKKILCLILAALTCISLCACGAKEVPEDEVRGEIVEGGDAAGDNEAQEGGSDSEKEPEFSIGKASGNTYKNDFLGLSCTLPSDWTFYSEEQMLEMNNFTGSYLDETVQEQIKNATIIYDMYAVRGNTGSSISINLEKLSKAQAAVLDLKDTLEAQISAIKNGYSNMGYTDIEISYQKVKVDGRSLDALLLTAELGGRDFTAVIFCFLQQAE